ELAAAALTIVILYSQQHGPGALPARRERRPRQTPHVDGIHHVSEMKEARRGRRKPGYHCAHYAKGCLLLARLCPHLDERWRDRSGQGEAWRVDDVRRRPREHAILATRSD